MSPADYAEMTGSLRDAMRARLGVRGKSLRAALRRGGRMLPAPARAAGQRIVQAEDLVTHPKLRRLVDGVALRADAAEMRAALGQIDEALLQRVPQLLIRSPCRLVCSHDQQDHVGMGSHPSQRI